MLPSRPKVLFYNWVPAFDVEKRGGGVTVYQDNCIKSFLDNGWDVYALSAGLSYDLLGGQPYIRKLPAKESRAGVFELVNSPVVAPTLAAFYVDQTTSGEAMDEQVAAVVIEFIKSIGPLDVFHVNNIEGIPVSVFSRLRQNLPDTRFILSLHNYYFMCPQANLWKHDSHSCDGKEDGRACVTCLGQAIFSARATQAGDAASMAAVSDIVFRNRVLPDRMTVKKAVRKALYLLKVPQALGAARRVTRRSMPFETGRRLSAEELQNYFRQRQGMMVEAINASFDVILCVSDRVREIAEAAGLSSAKCVTSYIGTKVYQDPLPIHVPADDGILRLAYLGYANKAKGFEFLLATLEQCPDELLGHLHVLLAARGKDDAFRDRLVALGKRTAGLTVQNGYTHQQLEPLLANVDVGVVPVIWEDCLPQVAIELVCNGVPIITSNLGGAREIGANPEFEFEAGNMAQLTMLIAKFANDKRELAKFWSKTPTLRSMDAHMAELAAHYGLATASLSSAAAVPAL